jgi:hypothetical protein
MNLLRDFQSLMYSTARGNLVLKLQHKRALDSLPRQFALAKPLLPPSRSSPYPLSCASVQSCTSQAEHVENHVELFIRDLDG